MSWLPDLRFQSGRCCFYCEAAWSWPLWGQLLEQGRVLLGSAVVHHPIRHPEQGHPFPPPEKIGDGLQPCLPRPGSLSRRHP
jgi:hypothetical protein